MPPRALAGPLVYLTAAAAEPAFINCVRPPSTAFSHKGATQSSSPCPPHGVQASAGLELAVTGQPTNYMYACGAGGVWVCPGAGFKPGGLIDCKTMGSEICKNTNYTHDIAAYTGSVRISGKLMLYTACGDMLRMCEVDVISHNSDCEDIVIPSPCPAGSLLNGVALSPTDPKVLVYTCSGQWSQSLWRCPLVSPGDHVLAGGCSSMSQWPCAAAGGPWNAGASGISTEGGGFTFGCSGNPNDAAYCATWSDIAGPSSCSAVSSARFSARSPCTSNTLGVADLGSGQTAVACGGDGYYVCEPSAPSTAPTAAPYTPSAPSASPVVPPTGAPTAPSSAPSTSPIPPTSSPVPPSASPTGSPIKAPTEPPTAPPSRAPVLPPSASPSGSPSMPPTKGPNPPTAAPVPSPTASPSMPPTEGPNPPTAAPVPGPTASPVPPSAAPTAAPMPPSAPPTAAPAAPTRPPTGAPTAAPTVRPSVSPFAQPSVSPTLGPSEPPTSTPSAAPTQPPAPPSARPSFPPTRPPVPPSGAPSLTPTRSPAARPTTTPTAAPTAQPSSAPTSAPSTEPTPAPARPSMPPTTAPERPSAAPSASPQGPSSAPSAAPSASQPSAAPAGAPSAAPTRAPAGPSAAPSSAPQGAPTAGPSATPAAEPTAGPLPAGVTRAPSPALGSPTISPLPRGPTAAPVPGSSPHQAAEDAANVGAAGATAAALAGGGAAAGGAQAGRLALMASGCPNQGPEKDMGIALHPTQLRLSSFTLPSHAGCILVSVLLVGGVAVLQQLVGLVAGKILGVSTLEGQGRIRSPALAIAAATVLCQGPVYAGARLLRYGSSALDYLVALAAVFAAGVMPMALNRAGRHGSQLSVFRHDAAMRQGCESWVLGHGEWFSLGDWFAVDRWGTAFRSARPNRHSIFAIDLAISHLALLGSGFGGGGCTACAVGRILDAVLAMCFAAGVVRFKPYSRTHRYHLVLLSQCVFTAASLAFAYGYFSDECAQASGKPILPGRGVAWVLLSISGGLMLLASILNAGATLRNVTSDRKKGLFEPVTKAWKASDDTGRLEVRQLQQLMAEHLNCTLSAAEAEELARRLIARENGRLPQLGSRELAFASVSVKELFESEDELWSTDADRPAKDPLEGGDAARSVSTTATPETKRFSSDDLVARLSQSQAAGRITVSGVARTDLAQIPTDYRTPRSPPLRRSQRLRDRGTSFAAQPSLAPIRRLPPSVSVQPSGHSSTASPLSPTQAPRPRRLRRGQTDLELRILASSGTDWVVRRSPRPSSGPPRRSDLAQTLSTVSDSPTKRAVIAGVKPSHGTESMPRTVRHQRSAAV
eukprot:TRINITY_DN4266_c0_g1_i3.p1 TRINITY_DN4266_c0_g1~~TRINITY_DN4266_c0_g1_i3.p1  ORF type:complete len:1326 (+),score=143.36 TRINITY_DN4266_c0_g1_i3:66-4043(+)